MPVVSRSAFVVGPAWGLRVLPTTRLAVVSVMYTLLLPRPVETT